MHSRTHLTENYELLLFTYYGKGYYADEALPEFLNISGLNIKQPNDILLHFGKTYLMERKRDH